MRIVAAAAAAAASPSSYSAETTLLAAGKMITVGAVAAAAVAMAAAFAVPVAAAAAEAAKSSARRPRADGNRRRQSEKMISGKSPKTDIEEKRLKKTEDETTIRASKNASSKPSSAKSRNPSPRRNRSSFAVARKMPRLHPSPRRKRKLATRKRSSRSAKDFEERKTAIAAPKKRSFLDQASTTASRSRWWNRSSTKDPRWMRNASSITYLPLLLPPTLRHPRLLLLLLLLRLEG